tara:strand:+ start:684 stop:1109 length:426 start_codon:yes stop_codon:yes gene_type:complete
MNLDQIEITLEPHKRGYHIITNKIESLPMLSTYKIGFVQIFIKHTSASLTINESSDPSVRNDFESSLNKIAPENQSYYTHNDEGPDDMPAHIKTSIIGTSITIPVTNGKLNMGIWQGIYLCEHRNNAGPRNIVITIQGDKA